MSIFNRLLGGATSAEPDSKDEKAVCLHGVLTPRWRNAGDMGQEHMIIGYVCQSCLEEFEPGDAHWLWLRAVDRLRDLKGSISQN
jgi:hypothetical protein